MHILIVDDDQGTRETLSIGLRRLGRHDVTTACTGREALALAATSAYDTVILDQSLPDIDGLDVLIALRATASAVATVYILTAYGSVDDGVLAMKRGATDYLRKETCDVVELSRLLSAADPIRTPTDKRVATVLDVIAQRPATPVPDLARAVNLSESRLRHLFSNETAIELGAYQREYRLERAALLLRVSFLAVSQIAHCVGWSDGSSFGAAFKERFGCTPVAYRVANSAHR